METSINNELQIATRLEQNDPKAFEEIFKVFFPSLVYFAASIVSSKEEGEDIAMESFRKFWQMRHNFQTLVNIRAFLFITTRNACLNYLKSAQHQRTSRNTCGEQDDYDHPGYEQAVDLMMIEAETLQIIYNAVKKLPKKCRLIFELTYFEGKSNREIAKQLNISTSTITSQRSRAIQFLKEDLHGIEWLLVYIPSFHYLFQHI